MVGPKSVLGVDPVLGGEDFAFYQQRIPGCFAFLGTGAADWKTRHSVHHPLFKVDENALPIGTAWHTQIILDTLGKSAAR